MKKRRHVRENMIEEELVIFDILPHPAPEPSAELKKIACVLLERLKELIVLDWR